MGGLADGTKGPEVASGDRLTLLWRRIKEHRIAQWTVGYVAVVYGIQHAVTLTSEAYEWPNIVARISMTLLALGLPLAMTLAWYHGGKVNRRMSGPELMIISLLLVAVSILFFVFVRPSSEAEPSATAAVQQSGVDAARSAATSPKGAISLAVLPFTNLSTDKEQEFFSDGITEEIDTALAKIPDLRVVARESAFQFKGGANDMRVVGQKLGATHLIEGSVRRDGNRVRITAQLVKSDDGVTVWSDRYDRELTDVFAIQEQIATAIAGALRMPLGLKPGESLVASRTKDPASYEQYLRAKALSHSNRYMDAIPILEDVVARNADFAPGWGLLGLAYQSAPGTFPAYRNGSSAELKKLVELYVPKAEAAARRSIQLDPSLAVGYVELGRILNTSGRRVEGTGYFDKALVLDPNDPDALNYRGLGLAGAGFTMAALASQQEVLALEPVYRANLLNLALAQWLNGQNDAAVATLRSSARPGPVLAMIYASMGRYNDAADEVLKLPPRDYPAGAIERAARILRSTPLKSAPAGDQPDLGLLSFVYLYAGAPERVLAPYQPLLDARYLIASQVSILWHPSYAPVRKTQGFKELMRKGGYLEYWRAKGWPPQCHPTTADDFECS